MPRQLFLAPAADGKTTFTLDIACQTAVSLQEEVRVCAPTGLQVQARRQRLADAGGAIGVHVLTFDRLVAACLNEAGEAYTELSDPVQYRLLRTVIDQLPLQLYAPLRDKPGFIQVAQQVITELKSARIFPEEFTAAVTRMGNEPRLRELADIYAAYQTQLQAQGWADRVGLHWLAVEALAERAPNACQEWPLLIVDGFDDFTPIQLALLQLLAERVSQFTITLPQAEQVTFPRYQNTQREVEAMLNTVGSPLPDKDKPSSRHPTLDYLAHNLFARSTDEPIANGNALTLCEAPDRASEARVALRWLKQQIVWDGGSPDDVALLARDITPYRPFIQQIAAEFGLPVRLVDGLPLQHSPVINALLSLLRLHLPTGTQNEPDLSRRQVVAVWRSPYFLWENGEATITPADADSLDAFARQHRIIRGLGQWNDAFAVGAAARENVITDEDEESRGEWFAGTAVQQLQRKFTYFLTVTQPPATVVTMREFVQWLENLIGPDPQAPNYVPPRDSLHITAQSRRNPATAMADIAALRTLKDILRGLVWAEEAVGQDRPVDYLHFFNELSGAIAATHFMLPIRAEQPEIIVANVTQARGLSFAAVAVMGLSEGSFPATISEDPFLRDADRQTLHHQFGFPLEPSTQSAEREFFYEAVTRARQNLLLTRPMLADNGAEWVASPFWEATRRLVAVEPESIASEAVVPLVETASWAEWSETMAANPNNHDQAQSQDAAIWQHIETAAAIWQTRAEGRTAVWDGDLSTISTTLTIRFGPEHIWSPSRLETYQTCGFMFFLQNVLKLEPRPEPAEGLDIRQLGRLYHDIFEQVTTAGVTDSMDEAEVTQLVIDIATPLLDTAPEREGFRETPWWMQTRREILDNVIRSVLILTAGDYEFFQAEAAFGIEGSPLTIPDGEDQLQLRGFIDRVDRRANDGYIRIIDYKSSGKTVYSQANFAKGKKLQLPLYALAAQETLGLGTIADGFYWHFQQAEASSFKLQKAEGGVVGAIETAVAHAWQAVHRIRSGQFTPQPPDGGCPTYCPAAGFCWQYAPRSW